MGERDYLAYLPLWLRHRLVAFLGSLKYGVISRPKYKILKYEGGRKLSGAGKKQDAISVFAGCKRG